MRQRDVNKLVGRQTIGEFGDAFDDMPEGYEPIWMEVDTKSLHNEKSWAGFILNHCPDCDAALEQRSMPSGIEEWCPVCNVRNIPEHIETPLETLKKRMEYNAHNLGDLGKFVKLEYINNFIDEYERKLNRGNNGD